MYQYYKLVRVANPHIPAWRVLGYLRDLDAEGDLKKAFRFRFLHRVIPRVWRRKTYFVCGSCQAEFNPDKLGKYHSGVCPHCGEEALYAVLEGKWGINYEN